jgi:hypothetical protein
MEGRGGEKACLSRQAALGLFSRVVGLSTNDNIHIIQMQYRGRSNYYFVLHQCIVRTCTVFASCLLLFIILFLCIIICFCLLLRSSRYYSTAHTVSPASLSLSAEVADWRLVRNAQQSLKCSSPNRQGGCG